MNTRLLSSDEARAQLYEIMAEDWPFEEKADRALELGEAFLGVQNAHLTRIDERIDFWEALASTDPPKGDFPPGEVLDLQTTYCRRVIEKGSSIALSDAPNQGWADDPAFKEHGLHCYHGTPLTIDGLVFGTLCFVSEEPRDEPFSESETLFAELLARMLEHEVRLARQTAEINLQSNLIGVLSRVLRHNLRNDLNVIRGQLTLMADRNDEPLIENKAAIKKIDKLVDLANTARQIESIATTDLDRQPVELNTLVQHVIDRVQSNHPTATLTIEGPHEVYLEAIPTLRTALEELVENAAKHSGENPHVTVSIVSSEDNIEIQVIDNGPGLPEQERAVLREGTEKPLIHGSGLGLWMTYWIVANHDGSIHTDVTDAGTRVTVSLPKASSLGEFADSETLLGRFHREQDKFEAVFEESFDAIVIFDDDGRCTDVNESAADLFGVRQEELHGRPIKEFLPKDFSVTEAWQSFQEAGRERDYITLHQPDGTTRTVEYTAVTDIVPGQHLAILRETTERVEIKTPS